MSRTQMLFDPAGDMTFIADVATVGTDRADVQEELDILCARFNGTNGWSPEGHEPVVAEIRELAGPGGGNPVVEFRGNAIRVAALVAEFFDALPEDIIDDETRRRVGRLTRQ